MVANLRQYITDGIIKGFYEWLLSERKVSEETAKKYTLAISKLYKETALLQKAYRLLTNEKLKAKDLVTFSVVDGVEYVYAK